jgi:hypothetical protein
MQIRSDQVRGMEKGGCAGLPGGWMTGIYAAAAYNTLFIHQGVRSLSKQLEA